MEITVKKQTNKLYANELQTFTHTEAGKQQQRTFAQTTATLRQVQCVQVHVCRCVWSSQQLCISAATSQQLCIFFAATLWLRANLRVNWGQRSFTATLRHHPFVYLVGISSMRTTTTIYLADSFCRAEQRLVYLEPRFRHDECSNIFFLLFHDGESATPQRHLSLWRQQTVYNYFSGVSSLFLLGRHRRISWPAVDMLRSRHRHGVDRRRNDWLISSITDTLDERTFFLIDCRRKRLGGTPPMRDEDTLSVSLSLSKLDDNDNNNDDNNDKS